MTVGELIERLKAMPQDAILVMNGYDHSYQRASAELTTALYDGSWFSEDHGEDVTSEAEFGKRIPILLVR